MGYKQIQGIYQITNTQNKKKYIGSAVSILARWHQHKLALRRGTHCNAHLQAAWLKYGEEAFTFEIVEVCSTANLQIKEEQCIKQASANDRKYGYNKRIDCKTNLGIKYSEASRKKLRDSHLGHKRSPEAQIKISQSQYKPVCQISKMGELIATYSSMQEAAAKAGVHRTAISMCCRGVLKSTNGSHWCYQADVEKFVIPISKAPNYRKYKNIDPVPNYGVWIYRKRYPKAYKNIITRDAKKQ